MGFKDRMAPRLDFSSRLAEHTLAAVKRGSHVLVEGSLVSSTYEVANGQGKKAKGTKVTSWSIRADVVRKLDRVELAPEASTTAESQHEKILF